MVRVVVSSLLCLVACGSSAKPQAMPIMKCKTCHASKRDAAVVLDAAMNASGDDAGSSVSTSLPDAASDASAPDADAAPRKGSGLCTHDGDCEEYLPVASAFHQDGTIHYPDPPPAGGDHNPCWASFGVHDDPVPAENWVHNLEHGAVVFLYQCACTEDVAMLESFVKAHRLTLLTAYGAMHKRFAVVAWGYRLQTDTLDLPAFEAFYAAHVDQAPESIASNPPASCGL